MDRTSIPSIDNLTKGMSIEYNDNNNRLRDANNVRRYLRIIKGKRFVEIVNIIKNYNRVSGRI